MDAFSEKSVIGASSVAASSAASLRLVRLEPLMARSAGRAEIAIGLIDGPVASNHPALAEARIREISAAQRLACAPVAGTACRHGTFIAGILCAKRGAAAPAICPGCTLIVRPIFGDTASASEMPSATPLELARAIRDCIEAGARVLNISAALYPASLAGDRAIEHALEYAVRSGVIVVVAAGNQGSLGSNALTSHPWVIPVAGYSSTGMPMDISNMGCSIGRRGVGAPGEHVISLGVAERPAMLSGTSAAAPFVTGTIALLLSEFPAATAARVRQALTRAHASRRATVVPPLLDAFGCLQAMISGQSGHGSAHRH